MIIATALCCYMFSSNVGSFYIVECIAVIHHRIVYKFNKSFLSFVHAISICLNSLLNGVHCAFSIVDQINHKMCRNVENDIPSWLLLKALNNATWKKRFAANGYESDWASMNAFQISRIVWNVETWCCMGTDLDTLRKHDTPSGRMSIVQTTLRATSCLKQVSNGHLWKCESIILTFTNQLLAGELKWK